MIDLNAKPQPWLSEDVANSSSWIHSLGSEAVEGLCQALEHAKSVGKPLLEMTVADFPLNEASRTALRRAVLSTQKGWGFCLVRGLPVRDWSEADTRLAYWGMGLHVGLARPQNAASEILNDVRDAGGAYHVKNGRGYNTNAKLDFHIDFCDVVGLLCRRTAKSGGTSLITSSLAIVEEIRLTHPHLYDTLHEPWHFSWQGCNAPGTPPTYSSPLLGIKDDYWAFRTNRKNIVAAQRDFPYVPRLTDKQAETLDLLDVLLPDPRFCFSMQLNAGDMQLLNNYVIVHSRTDFEDFDDPNEKRHLLRLWLNLPQSQPLPDEWLQAFEDTRPGSVRGGTRGSRITQAFLDYEARQAQHLGMPNQFVSI